jgi:hypothetical protein
MQCYMASQPFSIGQCRVILIMSPPTSNGFGTGFAGLSLDAGAEQATFKKINQF